MRCTHLDIPQSRFFHAGEDPIVEAYVAEWRRRLVVVVASCTKGSMNVEVLSWCETKEVKVFRETKVVGRE